MKHVGGLRYRVCPDCGEMHDKYDWPDNHRRPDEALSAPNVISDTQAPIKSMVDGKIYDSKAALRATYMPSGNREGKRYTELGNDPAITRQRAKPKSDRKAIRQSIEKGLARVANGEVTRETYQTKVLTRPGPI